MRISSIKIVYIILILFLSFIIPISVSSSDDSIPFWDEEWTYRQEILLPIDTND
ncbi:MAG: hypothetical protein R3255_07535 [Candidatus Lokiarchaeia archaeon]|nr:hypothetical protein [Candidatus Lokiarchaeia archaeon]